MNWVGGGAASYAHFQSVGYQAADAADPVIRVLNGGTEAVTPSLVSTLRRRRPTIEGDRFCSCSVLRFLWRNSLDTLDLHVGDFGPVWSPQIVDVLERAIQACNGGRHVPVWVTELATHRDRPSRYRPSTPMNWKKKPWRRGRPGSLFNRYVQSMQITPTWSHRLDVQLSTQRDPRTAARYERQNDLR